MGWLETVCWGRARKEKRNEGGNERRDQKVGVTSLGMLVKRDTRANTSRTKKEKRTERQIRGAETKKEGWTRFNGAFKFFRFFQKGVNNWGRKGIDP